MMTSLSLALSFMVFIRARRCLLLLHNSHSWFARQFCRRKGPKFAGLLNRPRPFSGKRMCYGAGVGLIVVSKMLNSPDGEYYERWLCDR
ncbi:unnamed protein product, partial [Mesorhabditis spiculigera]